MSRFFYARLAADNIRKNARTYVPYILTCIITVMMFYMMFSLSVNPGLQMMYGGQHAAVILGMGVVVVAIFAFVFLIYTNSFLIKRRKKEFGLFNILGMEKKHLSRLLFLETFYTALISLTSGVGLGIVMDKLMFLMLVKLIGMPVSLGFYVSGEVLAKTVLLFCGIFFLIYLKAVGMLHLSNPAELLRGASEGEKEPRAKWLLAALGVAALAVGYYIGVTAKNPLAALEKFFVAVMLVIIGTYLLFTAGSIAFLKLLRKNERYYYKTKHFISVSGMIYRMKQNAVGLANICILSTMVLVMISTTGSMIVGMDDIIRTRFPNEFIIKLSDSDERQREVLKSGVEETVRREQLSADEMCCYSYLEFSAVYTGGEYRIDDDFEAQRTLDNFALLVVIPVSDYNAAAGENVLLKDGEVLMYPYRDSGAVSDTVTLAGQQYRVAKVLKRFPNDGFMQYSAFAVHYMVVSDGNFERIRQNIEESTGESCPLDVYLGFDIDEKEESVKQAFFDKLRTRLYELGLSFQAETRLGVRSDFVGLYGGLFFLGVFLGILFTMAMVLIIYYKQISEGYEDRERFVIMQKVGMSLSEVKSAIHSQVLTVFYLPLVVAGFHMAAAFPILKELLAALNMANVKLYALFAAGCFLVFAVLYTVVYSLTAKTYFKIVKK